VREVGEITDEETVLERSAAHPATADELCFESEDQPVGALRGEGPVRVHVRIQRDQSRGGKAVGRVEDLVRFAEDPVREEGHAAGPVDSEQAPADVAFEGPGGQ